VRKAWVEEGKRTIRTANELKISLINFHGHSMGMFMTIPSAKKQILDILFPA